MKKFLFLIILVSSILKLSGQSQGISYQAVLINSNDAEIPGIDVSGAFLPNQPITIRFTILNEVGSIDYQEEHQTITDDYGMISLFIGWGTVTLTSPGTFIDIDWNGTPKNLSVEISLGENSNSFELFSYEVLTFVPYAFHRNITATGNMIIEGTTDLNSTLNVNYGSSTNLSGNLTVSEFSVLNNDLTVNAESFLNGQVTIFADLNGNDDNIDVYPLRINGSNQGVAITIDGSRNSDNNFITFWDNAGIQGRIEGQTATDLLTEPQYIFDQALYTAQTIAQGINLATATASAIVDPGNLVIEIANTATLAAEIIAYNVFAIANLGVTYESGSGDYAEWLPRLDPKEEIVFGQVVGVFGGKISKKTEGAEMIMVVSKSPVVLGNMPPDSINQAHFEMVAFMGQVPVRIIGKVNKGDYVIPYESGSGYGKAVAPEHLTIDMTDKIVGRAWSDGDNSVINFINTVIGIRNVEWKHFIGTNRKEIDVLKKENKQLKDQLIKTNQLLAELVPGFKEAMDRESDLLEKDISDVNNENISNVQDNIKLKISDVTVTREHVIEAFILMEEIMKEKGVDNTKFHFFVKFNNDPEYRERIITETLESIQNQ